jgi:hypothetical protein
MGALRALRGHRCARVSGVFYRSSSCRFSSSAKRLPLNGYAALFGQGFEQIRNGLRILAASENAGSGDWNDIKGPLAIFTSGTPTSAAVEVMGTGRMRRETFPDRARPCAAIRHQG